MRLIDAQPVLDYSHNKNIRVCTVDLLEALPVVDAVPVVRCRECKHNRNCFIKEMIIAETKQDNPYCSCGAKMEDKP